MSKIVIRDPEAGKYIQDVVIPTGTSKGLTKRQSIDLFLKQNPTVKFEIVEDDPQAILQPIPPQAPQIAPAMPVEPVPTTPQVQPESTQMTPVSTGQPGQVVSTPAVPRQVFKRLPTMATDYPNTVSVAGVPTSQPETAYDDPTPGGLVSSALKGLGTGLAVDLPRQAVNTWLGARRIGKEIDRATGVDKYPKLPVGLGGITDEEAEQVYKDVKDITERTEQLKAYKADVEKMSQTEKDVYSGLRSLPVSLGSGAIGAGTAAILAPVGVPLAVGAAASSLIIMGLSSGEDFIRNWEEKTKTDPRLNGIVQKLADAEGISFDDAKKKMFETEKINQKGILYGLSEAIPEALGNLVTYWTAGFGGTLGKTMSTPIKTGLKSALTTGAKMLGGEALEVGTELVTSTAQRAIEESAGETVEPLKKILRDTFGSTLAMTLISGGVLKGGNLAMRYGTKADINNAKPADVVATIVEDLKAEGKVTEGNDLEIAYNLMAGHGILSQEKISDELNKIQDRTVKITTENKIKADREAAAKTEELTAKGVKAEGRIQRLSVDPGTGLKSVEALQDAVDHGSGKRPKFLYVADVSAVKASNFGQTRAPEGDANIKEQAHFVSTIGKVDGIYKYKGGDELAIASDDPNIPIGKHTNPNFDLWLPGKGGPEHAGDVYVLSRIELKPDESMESAIKRLQAEETAGNLRKEALRPKYENQPVATREEFAKKLEHQMPGFTGERPVSKPAAPVVEAVAKPEPITPVAKKEKPAKVAKTEKAEEVTTTLEAKPGMMNWKQFTESKGVYPLAATDARYPALKAEFDAMDSMEPVVIKKKVEKEPVEIEPVIEEGKDEVEEPAKPEPRRKIFGKKAETVVETKPEIKPEVVQEAKPETKPEEKPKFDKEKFRGADGKIDLKAMAKAKASMGLSVKDVTKGIDPEYIDFYDAIIENAKLDGHTTLANVMEYGKTELSQLADSLGDKLKQVLDDWIKYITNHKMFAEKPEADTKTGATKQRPEGLMYSKRKLATKLEEMDSVEVEDFITEQLEGVEIPENINTKEDLISFFTGKIDTEQAKQILEDEFGKGGKTKELADVSEIFKTDTKYDALPVKRKAFVDSDFKAYQDIWRAKMVEEFGGTTKDFGPSDVKQYITNDMMKNGWPEENTGSGGSRDDAGRPVEKTETTETVEKTEEQKEIEEETKTIENFKTQLLNAGIPQEQIDANMALFESVADFSSLTVAEVINHYNLSVEKGGTVDPAALQKVKDDIKGSILISNVKSVVKVFDKADASTFPHEMAHLYRNIVSEFRPDAVEEMDLAFGIKDGIWTTENDEAFAEGWEEYLRRGKSPTPELTNIFQKFAKWLTDVYQGIRSTLSQEKIDFYDKMLGKVNEDYIERGGLPAYTGPSDMDILLKIANDQESSESLEATAADKDTNIATPVSPEVNQDALAKSKKRVSKSTVDILGPAKRELHVSAVRDGFIDNAVDKGLSIETADALFELVDNFSNVSGIDVESIVTNKFDKVISSAVEEGDNIALQNEVIKGMLSNGLKEGYFNDAELQDLRTAGIISDTDGITSNGAKAFIGQANKYISDQKAPNEDLEDSFAVLKDTAANKSTEANEVLTKIFDRMFNKQDWGKSEDKEDRAFQQTVGDITKRVNPAFFSKLQRVLEEKMPNKADSNVVSRIIANSGVKQEEIIFSGIADYLAENKNITKGELLSFLKENEVQIEVVTYTGGNTRFDGYRLPGGENYREIVVRQSNAKNKYSGGHYKLDNVLFHVRLTTRTAADGTKTLFVEEVQSDLHQTARDIRKFRIAELARANGIIVPSGTTKPSQEYLDLIKSVPMNYGYQKSNDEAAPPISPYSRTWHEQAMKRALRLAIEEGADSISWTTGEIQGEIYPSMLRQIADNISWSSKSQYRFVNPKEDLVDDYIIDNPNTEVPIGSTTVAVEFGPFANDMEKVVAKYDGKILFVDDSSGEFDSSYDEPVEEVVINFPSRAKASEFINAAYGDNTNKTISPLATAVTHKLVNGEKRIELFNYGNKDGIIIIDKNGIIIDDTSKSIIGENINDIFGQDVAKQIINKPDGEIKEQDFIIGDEGMKGFYDKILVDYMNKYAKINKWGTTVTDISIGAGGKNDSIVSDVSIAFYLKLAEGGGFGKFLKKMSAVDRDFTSEEINKILQEIARNEFNERGEGAIAATNTGNKFEDYNVSFEKLQTNATTENKKNDDYRIWFIPNKEVKNKIVHNLPITQKMKDDILYKGQELFQKVAPKKENIPSVVKIDIYRNDNKVLDEILTRAIDETIRPSAWDRFKNSVENRMDSIKESLGKSFEKIDKDIYDRFQPIRQVFSKTGGVLKYGDAYEGARLLNSKSTGIIKDLSDQLWDMLGKNLKNGRERNLFESIFSLRNFMDMDRAGATTSGITEKIASESLAAIKSDIGEEAYNRISNAVDEAANWLTDSLLTRLVDNKVITKETAGKWKIKYPHYLPSLVDADNMEPGKVGGSALSAEPLVKIKTPFLKRKAGTELPIRTDTINLMHEAIARIVTATEKIQVLDNIFKEFGVVTDVPVAKAAKYEKRRSRVLEKIDGKLQEVEKSKLTEVQEKLQELLDREKTLKSRRERVTGREAPTEFDMQKIAKVPLGYREVLVKGSDRKIYAVPEDVFEMINGMNKLQSDIMTKMLAKYNVIFRTGATTHRVAFGIFSNPFRDIQNAYMNMAGNQVLPRKKELAAYLQAFVESFKSELGMKSDLVRDWKLSGGGFGGLLTSMPTSLSKPSLKHFKLMSTKEKLQNIVSLPVEAIVTAGSIMENTTRLAEWIRSEGILADKGQRALQSRDVTVDFNKMGDAMKLLNTVTPFLNANLQGNVNLIRKFRDNLTTSAARFVLATIMPEVMLYMWNSVRNKDDDDKVDPWIKDNYWYVITGAHVTNANGEELPVLITIRKGEYAQNPFIVLPQGKLIRGILDKFYQKDPAAFEGFAEDYLKSVPFNIINQVVPPIIKTPLELTANFSFFKRGPIVGMGQEKNPEGRKFSGYESKTARWIGDKLGMSATKLEYAAKGVYPAVNQLTAITDMFIKDEPKRALVNKQEFIKKVNTWFPLITAPTGRGREYEKMRIKANELAKTRSGMIDVIKESYYSKVLEHNDLMKKIIEERNPKTQEELIHSLSTAELIKFRTLEKQIDSILTTIPPDEDAARLISSWDKNIEKFKDSAINKLIKSQPKTIRSKLTE